MKIRSLFKKVFGDDKNVQLGTRLQLVNGYEAVFTNYDGQIYDNPTVRACIDTIARNAAKLNPKHIRSTDKNYKILNEDIYRIIAEQPNEIMNAYDFYYKIFSELYLNNNVFVYIMRDENLKVIGLYPILFNQADFVEYQNQIYVKFRFGTGKIRTVAYNDLIHLRRFFCKNDILGGSNLPVVSALSFQHILKEGIINAIKITMSIKGYLKSTKSMLSPKDAKKLRDNFIKDFVSDDNSSGIGALDATTDFKEVNLDPTVASDAQITDNKNEILDYFNLNENIIQSKYSEDEWNAFYESVLEPLGIQIGMEFTNKIFTYGERYHGNKIIFEANRLQYASNKTKIEVARYLNNYLYIDEIREILNLAPLPNGEGQKLMQDLNHINSNIADTYQGGGNNG